MNVEKEKRKNDYNDIFEKTVVLTISEAEKKIGRPLTESQKQGLRNAGTLMFLESMSMGLYFAKSDEDLKKWLQEIDGFVR